MVVSKYTRVRFSRITIKYFVRVYQREILSHFCYIIKKKKNEITSWTNALKIFAHDKYLRVFIPEFQYITRVFLAIIISFVFIRTSSRVMHTTYILHH